VYHWCEFKSCQGKNKNLTAQKSNSNTVWFNFQTYIYISGYVANWVADFMDGETNWTLILSFHLDFIYIKYLICILLKISSCCRWQLSKYNDVLYLRLKCPIRGAVKVQLHIKNRSIPWLWYCILKMTGKHLCNKLWDLSYVQ
jgi:hypothetical protein